MAFRLLTATALTGLIIGCTPAADETDDTEVESAESTAAAPSDCNTAPSELFLNAADPIAEGGTIDSIENAEVISGIDGYQLQFEVRYTGGNEPHNYRLHSGQDLEASPPQVGITVHSYPADDDAKALMCDRVELDLEAFEGQVDRPYEIVLKAEGIADQRVLVDYPMSE